jgi:hypothetical protein
MSRYASIYRGVILNTADPNNAGRMQVRVPEVFGAENAWAGVCKPLGSAGKTGPSIGSQVWVMFEGGDAARPVVMGALS